MSQLADELVRTTLAGLSTYETDWDSYGGLPPTPEAIAGAQRLIADVAGACGRNPLDIAPSPDGGVSIRWTFREVRIEVEVLADGTPDRTEVAVEYRRRTFVRLPPVTPLAAFIAQAATYRHDLPRVIDS